jgi:hypothetical protein
VIAAFIKKEQGNPICFFQSIGKTKFCGFLTKPPFSHYKFSSKLNPAPDLGEFGCQVTHLADNFG